MVEVLELWVYGKRKVLGLRSAKGVYVALPKKLLIQKKIRPHFYDPKPMLFQKNYDLFMVKNSRVMSLWLSYLDMVKPIQDKCFNYEILELW